MGRGLPLDDEDRWEWLHTIHGAALAQLEYTSAVVVSCSALKRKYRDIMRGAGSNQDRDRTVQVCFFQLRVSSSALETRVAARSGHYMKKDMVRSQLLALEEAADDEMDIFALDGQRPLEAVCEHARMLAAAVLGCHKQA